MHLGRRALSAGANCKQGSIHHEFCTNVCTLKYANIRKHTLMYDRHCLRDLVVKDLILKTIVKEKSNTIFGNKLQTTDACTTDIAS